MQPPIHVGAARDQAWPGCGGTTLLTVELVICDTLDGNGEAGGVVAYRNGKVPGVVRFIVVEDEMLIALEVQDLIEDLGHEVVGVAPDADSARALTARGADFAIVDVNLRDGPTGREIAADLALSGISILFVTANPAVLTQRIEGAIGVLPKPLANEELEQAVRYITAIKAGMSPPPPPARMRAFA